MTGTEEKNSNKDLIYTSDDESKFYPTDKIDEVDNILANGVNDIDQLENGLNELTIHPSSNVQSPNETTDNDHISNPTILHNIVPEVKVGSVS